jgi:hypothetical protein
MGYYDNVKDSIRDENSEKDSKDEQEASGSDSSSSPGPGNFDTLREAAEETEVEEDEGGDDTPIEVLEEDGLKKEKPSGAGQSQKQEVKRSGKASQQESQVQRKEKSTVKQKSSQPQRQDSRPENSVSGDTSDLEGKLDKIIEQNSRMIEILEGFGN